MKLFINGNSLNLPKQPLGGGGEASVYAIDTTTVAKIFHIPDSSTPADQKKAMGIKLALQQKKLPSFPKTLPGNVITPQTLITDAKGIIVGYTMKLIDQAQLWVQYVNPANRINDKQNNEVTKSLIKLYDTVQGLHQKKVTVGDFNDLNIMVQKGNIYMIDADSYQWDKYPCDTFTQKYVDPLLCIKDATSNQLMLNKHHNDMSDWYAYTIMWMEALMFGGPYAGIYRPQDQKKRIDESLRPLKRITIFDPEVKRPKIIMPDNLLPDDLLHHFYETFVKDQRKVPDKRLLEQTQWQTCTQCGTYHARHQCPVCSHALPAQIKHSIKVYGNITADTIFQTTGSILYATIQDGRLFYLVHEDGAFKREGGKKLMDGTPVLGMKYGIVQYDTYIAHEQTMVTVRSNGSFEKNALGRYEGHPMVATNSHHAYWLERDQIMRSDDLAPRSLGDVLQDRTVFWTGETFGVGIYGVPGFYIPFVFDALHKGLNDTVKLPGLNGRLIDGFATFTNNIVWLWLISEEKNVLYYHGYVIDNFGKTLAEVHEHGETHAWMSNIRGKYASGNFCFAPTDDGMVRLSYNQGGTIFEEKAFPDTEKWVNANTRILVGKDGIYAINAQSITNLKTS